MTWTPDPTLSRIAKSAFSLLVALVCYWTAAAAPARLYDRSSPPAKPRSSTFRDGCMEALVSAGLETPYTVPPQRPEEGIFGLTPYRRLTDADELPIGWIGSLDRAVFSVSMRLDTDARMALAHQRCRPVVRGFAWAFASRVPQARRRAVRERLDSLVPDRAELLELTTGTAPPGWTRIDYEANAPKGWEQSLSPLLPGHDLHWMTILGEQNLSLRANAAARVQRSFGAYLAIELPADVWWEAATGRLVLRSQKDGKWLVVHVPSWTILLETDGEAEMK